MAKDDLQSHQVETQVPDDEYARQVRTALDRLQAPEGFTERVMARAELTDRTVTPARRGSDSRFRKVLSFTRPAWRLAYAAAAVLAITVGAIHTRHAHVEEQRAQIAAAQFDEALQVTHRALDHVSDKLQTTELGEIQRVLETNKGGK